MSAYETFGPYPLERDGHRLASGALRRFWKEREEDSRPGLRDAVGVYIFSVQKDEGAELVPWYVGKTDRQGFETRFGQEELRFRQVLENAKRGQLQILVVSIILCKRSGSCFVVG